MSNTIQRPRQRPRNRSLSWASFWWLVRMEASYQTVQREVFAHDTPACRALWYQYARYHVRRHSWSYFYPLTRRVMLP